MANHMKEIAEMLGVELNEEFYIKGHPGSYCLTEYYGLMKDCAVAHPTIFVSLLTGGSEIVRKPWKPKDGDYYYYVGAGGAIIGAEWRHGTAAVSLYKLGNCYRTEEAAEADAEKWKAFYSSDGVLEIGGDNNG